MLFTLSSLSLIAQDKSDRGAAQPKTQDTQEVYRIALYQLDSLAKTDGQLKQAVWIVENAYFDNQLDRKSFENYIQHLKKLCLAWYAVNRPVNYNFADSINFRKNFAVYAVLKDTVKVIDDSGRRYAYLPYSYDFSDFSGQQNWANMFVSKLLITRSGNCHSLPLLYKILAEEVGASCWLAFAPNHLYIKNHCEQVGWYNTELTSGTFPVDGWIMASGYLPLRAIKSGIFMDTLSSQANFALCMLDLAKGFVHRTHLDTDSFVLQCCDLSLQYNLSGEAILLKAETLKKIYEKQAGNRTSPSTELYNEITALYAKLFDLGYREMPESMYKDWLHSIQAEKAKYSNRPLIQALPK